MLRLTTLMTVTWLAGCAAHVQERSPAPRNVILMVGDGMGISTVTAARILAGQMDGGPGEDHNLSFDEFPNVALVKTYGIDTQVSSSAGTMSAMVTGALSRESVLSLAGSVPRGDCAAALKQPRTTLLERAEQAGFATGVVTTTRITHATPGATYAHSAERGWEVDAAMPAEARQLGCRDIARQLIEFDQGDGIEVALGGGRAHFLPAGLPDPERPRLAGDRADGRNLPAEWLAADPERRYVWNAGQLAALDPSATGAVLGLFEPSHMQYETDRDTSDQGDPSLAAMTAFAIRKLSRNERGFFLVVEGGRIDHAHHDGNAYRALTEAVAFDAAVRQALALTDPSNTLILVTADHSHTLTITGYTRRGNPILGKARWVGGSLALDTDGRPFTTLGYANGPGYRSKLPNLTGVDTTAPDFVQIAAYPLHSESHAGEDVPAYAHGLGAERLRGVIPQYRIYDVLYQALFGRSRDRCPGGF